jgi:hypothetical protein
MYPIFLVKYRVLKDQMSTQTNNEGRFVHFTKRHMYVALTTLYCNSLYVMHAIKLFPGYLASWLDTVFHSLLFSLSFWLFSIYQVFGLYFMQSYIGLFYHAVVYRNLATLRKLLIQRLIVSQVLGPFYF